MISKMKSSLNFKNYVVEKVEFKTNFNFTGEEEELDFDFNSSYEFEENDFMVKLEMDLFPEAEKNNYPFNMKIEILGLFEVESELGEREKIIFAEKNAIAILFPYLRALVSLYTSNSNIGTTILPPINVVKYLDDKNKK